MERFEFEISTPEAVGISSQNIKDFLQKIRDKKICMHSILMIHKGKVIYEEYAKPYTADYLQRMYSVSKSFTALAVGFLEEDGLISLDDKIVDYFPDMAGEDCHPLIRETTIRELLMMTGPFGTLKGFNRNDPNWTANYFKKIPTYPSGTLFCYDTSGTRVLTALVERLTKKPYIEYLKDKCLRELGFSENSWCIKTPDGFSHGGSGLMATLRDMARFGILLMGKGVVNGKRYINEKFITDAVSPLTFNDSEYVPIRTHEGYGYQIWCMEKGFALKGMGSQQVICVPEKDFIFCCTGDTQGNRIHYEGLYDYLFFDIIDKISPVKEAEDKLTLDFYALNGRKYIPLQDKINNVTYKLYENKMEISDLTLSFGEESKLILNTPRGKKEIKFAMGEYIEGTFPETHYSGEVLTVPVNREYKCKTCGAWVSDNQLLIRSYIIDDYLGNLTITIGFKGNKIGLKMVRNAEFFLEEYEGSTGGEAIQPVKL